MPPARSDGVRRREELLDAALRCFIDAGILGVGIEQIRRAAGASPSSVYHHFEGGREAILLALLIRTFDRLFAHLSARVVACDRAEAAVHALVDGHLAWVLENRGEARFMYQAMALEVLPAAGVTALAAEKAAMMGPIVAHMGRFIAAGELPAWSPIMLDVVLLGPSHEACRRLLGGAALDPAWMRETLPALAWRSLAGARGGIGEST